MKTKKVKKEKKVPVIKKENLMFIDRETGKPPTPAKADGPRFCGTLVAK